MVDGDVVLVKIVSRIRTLGSGARFPNWTNILSFKITIRIYDLISSTVMIWSLCTYSVVVLHWEGEMRIV